MKRIIYGLVIACSVWFTEAKAQVMDPNDPMVEYDEDNPPARPPSGTIAKWVRTKRVNWNTDDFKSYYYNGMSFRLRFPENYDASGNTKYPMLVMLHGRGESGSIYDNENNLKHAARDHENHVKSGDFDGFLFFPQNSGGFWGTAYFETINDLLVNHFSTVNVDPDRVIIHGLSSGGQGVWNYISAYPKTIAAAMPMSAASPNYYDGIDAYKYLPIWLSQGGQDRAPTSFTSRALVNEIEAAGGNIRYTLYHNLGHGVWNTHYSESDFWPFINRAHRTNPVVMTGELTLVSTSSSRDVYEFITKEEICPGDPIDVRLGITSGFEAYEWRKDGVVISGASGNELQVTSFGVYDVRFMENGVWNGWSQKSIEVKEKAATITPDIQVSGLRSRVLPAPDGTTSVPLELPEGYIEYGWKKENTNTILSTNRVFEATETGNYIATVTEQFGCSSSFSNPFTVIDANGVNKPSDLSSLAAYAISKTAVKLQWSNNETGLYPATHFEIYRTTSAGTGYELIAIVDAQDVEYIDEGLQANTNYFYILRPINNFAAAATTEEVSVQTQVDAIAPSTPLNLRVVATGSNYISIEWDESTDDVGVHRYDVYKDGVRSIVTEGTSATLYNLNEGQSYRFLVKARDLTGNTSPFSNMVIGVAVASGINYKFYDKTWGGSNLPDFTTLEPITSGIVPNFDITVRTKDTNYGFLFEGEINIPVAGSYTFETRSDDGSKLYIGGYSEDNLVVNNDGGHGMQYREGTYVFPEAGAYPIAVSFYQGSGGQGLEVYWKNTAHGVTSRQQIPDEAFQGQIDLGGTPPLAPSGLLAQAVSYDQIDLSWTDNSTDELGFQIYRSLSSGGPFLPITITSANETSFSDVGLQGSTTYYYQIISLGEYGPSGEVVAASSTLGDINNGVAAQDNATGTGYIMFSQENVFSRFSGNTPNSANSDHLIAIKYISGQWYYDNNNNYYNLDIQSGDLILAEVDFANDQINGLEGTSSDINGIEAGFASGDLSFFADRWNGGNNDGEFTINGTYFNRNNSDVVSATTLALPAAPDAVANFELDAKYTDQAILSWDASPNTDSYELVRSLDGVTFLPVLDFEPSGTTNMNFTDEGLDAHTTYYYQIVSINAGGRTESVVVSGQTLNHAPELDELPETITMRYGTTYDLPLYASDADSDAITFTSTGLPGFAELIDYEDGSGLLRFTPQASDQTDGTYPEITIKASDAFGGSDSTLLTIVVNDNHQPTLTEVSPISVAEGSTIMVNVVASDEEGAQNLSWESDFPSFVTLSMNIDGTADLHVSPGYADHGSYGASITVTDQDGGSASTTFDITVSDEDPNKRVLVNFRHNANAPSPWNNIATTGLHALTDTEGGASGISLELQTSTWKSYNQGAQTGNDTGAFPDAVLQGYYYFGIFGAPETVTIKLTGLTVGTSYDFSFLASSVWTGVSDNGTTVYSIDGESSSVYAQANTQNTADFSGILPNGSGEVYVTMSKGANTSVGYLNGFSLSSSYGADEVPVAPRGLSASLSGSSVLLSWVDAPYNESGFNVYRSTTEGGPYTKLGEVGAGVEIYEDATIEEGATYYYTVTAFNANGESGYADAVSFIVPNTPPVIALNGSTTVYVNQTSSLTVEVSDSPGNTVDLSVSGLPSFASYVETATGGELTFNAVASDIGSYTIYATATDNVGAETSEEIVLTVEEEQLYSVSLNFSRNYTVSSPWNNTGKNPVNGDVFSNLIDQTGTATPVDVTLLTDFGGLYNEGATTGDNSGVIPDNALREYYYWGIYGAPDVVQMKVSGLDYNNKYTFKFVGSTTFSGSGITDNGETNYTIGNKTVSVDVQGNTDRIGVLSGITADSNGEVIITMSKGSGASVGYINALVIESYAGDPSIFDPSDLTASALSKSAIGLSWSDNSFDEELFEVYRSTDESGPYSLIGTVGSDQTSYEDSGLSAGSIYYYKVRASYGGGLYSDYTESVASGTISYYVYVNINGAPEYDAGIPWNNLSVTAQTDDVFTGFKSENGSNTGMAMEVVQGMQGSNDWGATTGDDSGVYPDNVMQSFYFNDRLEAPGHFKLLGLDGGFNYNLKFFGSIETNYNIVTRFTAGGQTVSNNQTDNVSEVVGIYGLEANEDGELEFTVQEDPNSTWAIFNAFVLEAYPKEVSNVFARGAGKGGDDVIVGDYEVRYGESAVSISYYPNPVSDRLNIVMEKAPAREAVVRLHDLQGNELFMTSTFLKSVNTELSITDGFNDLESGMYIVSVQIGEQRFFNRIIKK